MQDGNRGKVSGARERGSEWLFFFLLMLMELGYHSGIVQSRQD